MSSHSHTSTPSCFAGGAAAGAEVPFEPEPAEDGGAAEGAGAMGGGA